MLSIILPTIRLDKLPECIKSIDASLHSQYELICISPYEKPESLKGWEPIKWFIDKGSPTRCQQIGLWEATGEYFHRATDDAIYVPNELYEAMKMVTRLTGLITRHTESSFDFNPLHPKYPDMQTEEFYTLGYHKQTQRLYVPAHYRLMSYCICPTAVMRYLGGYDCKFETIAHADLDFAIRMQMAGFKVNITDKIVLHCDWEPGDMGTHGPMHHAFPSDQIKYEEIYDKPSCQDRIQIRLDNWKYAPPVWGRRFGQEEL